MKTIKLTQNKYALVDDDDFDFLDQFNWSAYKDGKTYYATTHIYKNKKRTTILMHRMILKNPKSMIDHINNDGLDNRKNNLRLATNSQNQANRGLPITNTSGFKGVFKQRNKWRSVILKDGIKFELGIFETAKQAGEAYNIKSKELFGNFAKI